MVEAGQVVVMMCWSGCSSSSSEVMVVVTVMVVAVVRLVLLVFVSVAFVVDAVSFGVTRSVT